jgi:hypothetical protein
MTGTPPRHPAQRIEATGIRRPTTQGDQVTDGELRLVMAQVAVRRDVGTASS